MSSSVIACQMYKVFRGQKATDLFVYFSNNTLQKCLITLAVATKETDFPTLEHAWNIVALLKQKTIESVDEDCAGKFSTPGCAHGRVSSLHTVESCLILRWSCFDNIQTG